jgi:hypothetical protein
MSSPMLLLLQAALLGLVAWGGYLCLAKRDRRSGRDRRGPGRGGRRIVDAPRTASPGAEAGAAADPGLPESAVGLKRV